MIRVLPNDIGCFMAKCINIYCWPASIKMLYLNSRQNAVRVYNCTSGALNPLRWEELGNLTQYHSLTAPSKYLQWYPGFSFRTNRMVHRLCEILFHFVPAFVLDIVLRLTGSKPMYV